MLLERLNAGTAPAALEPLLNLTRDVGDMFVSGAQTHIYTSPGPSRRALQPHTDPCALTATHRGGGARVPC